MDTSCLFKEMVLGEEKSRYLSDLIFLPFSDSQHSELWFQVTGSGSLCFGHVVRRLRKETLQVIPT